MYARRRAHRPGAHPRRRPAAASRRCGAPATPSVGEFHYVHHQPDGTPYERPNALAEAVCDAAEEVGLRIVLLLVAYAPRAARGVRPSPGSGASATRPSTRTWSGWRPCDALGRRPAAGHGRSGARTRCARCRRTGWRRSAPTARRAATRCTSTPTSSRARSRSASPSTAAGRSSCWPAPTSLGPRTTIVHGTHCDDAEIELLARHARDASAPAPPPRATSATATSRPSGCTTPGCACAWDPTPTCASTASRSCASSSWSRAAPRCAATCSYARARTARRRRCCGRAGPTGRSRCACRSRASRAGAPADLVAWRLDGDELHGVADDDLAAALVFSGSARSVDRTWVDGREDGA